MSTARAWMRLRRAEWFDAFRRHPRRRTLAVLLWWVPAVVVPLASCFSPALATAATGLLLDIDVPLTLILAAVTAVLAARAREQARADGWLWPARFRPAVVRWLERARWVIAARWPLGLAIASTMLRIRLPEPLQAPASGELWMMSMLALAGGLGLAWMTGSRRAQDSRDAPRRRVDGMAALSWAPLHETRSRLALSRLSMLAVPALLAAPAGAQFRQAMEVLLVFLAAATVATLVRETWQVQSGTRRWLWDAPVASHEIAWWSWRLVAASLVALLALLALWPHGTANVGAPE